MELTVDAELPDKAALQALPALLLCLPENPNAALWLRLPAGAHLQRRLELLRRRAPATRQFTLDLATPAQTHLTVTLLPAGASAFERLGALREALADHLKFAVDSLHVALAGFSARESAEVAEAAVAAAAAAVARMPSERHEPEPGTPPGAIGLFGLKGRRRFQRTLAEGAGNTLARQLTSLPGNALTPAHYRERLETLAGEEGWQLEFYDTDRLRGMQAGAFLAVAQGSPEADAGIAKLSYRPRRKPTRGPLALVGKGICFDTGGVNLKPAKSMLGMHEDMAGSAVALGTLLALGRLRVPFAVDAWLALAQNHIGPAAYKPNDVVRALNGRSIEIVHTDAEGRMVLADTLTLASRAGPELLVDYATLTGACIYALGKGYSGAFTNRPDWVATLIEAGRESGERVWPFPLDADYDEALKSRVADTLQCAPDGEADHILAARFLQGFLEGKTAWVHLDMASASRPGGLAHVPTDVTGFGVRYTLALLEKLGWLKAGQG